LYHVIARGIEWRKIFIDREDEEDFLVDWESRFELREVFGPYFHVFRGENVDLSEKNTFFWKQSFKRSAS